MGPSVRGVCQGEVSCRDLHLLRNTAELPSSLSTIPHRRLATFDSSSATWTQELRSDMFLGKTAQDFQVVFLTVSMKWGPSLADSGGGAGGARPPFWNSKEGLQGGPKRAHAPCAPPLLKFQRGSSNGTAAAPPFSTNPGSAPGHDHMFGVWGSPLSLDGQNSFLVVK